MTAVSERVATLMDGTRPVVYQYQHDQFGELVAKVLATNGEHRLYAQDMRPLHEQRRVAENVLVVMVLDGWAAAYYRGEDHRAWITFTAQVSPDAPELIYDPYTGSTFPPDAVLSVAQFGPVVEEYLETGGRPTEVEWREPDRYLIY